MNRTPKSWKRDTAWKYGNRPPLDVDPLHVPEATRPDPGRDEEANSVLGWAMVALVVIGVVFLIAREVWT